ncbi:MAG TPA: hypothetical protein ENK41_00265 [Rhodobacteraceae bacterium]|nr:hypothetical protein [Paracoccaceae bacterium]
MKFIPSLGSALAGGFSASAAFAQQSLYPITVTAAKGQEGVDQAMMWLAITAIAMIAALWAVHWSIFRRK